MKLNIGCGSDKRTGYLNIDAVEAVEPDLVLDLLQKWPFSDTSVSEILAHDILEHFTREQLNTHILPEISRVLTKGGRLRFRTPNPDAIISKYAHDPEVRNEFLYGTTRETGVFGAHKVGFTKTDLITLLYSHGLWIEKLQEIDTNFEGICGRYCVPQIIEPPILAESFTEFITAAFQPRASIWVVDPAQLAAELKNPVFWLLFKLIRNKQTLVVGKPGVSRAQLTGYHFSLAKIRLLDEVSLADVLLEAQLRQYVAKQFR